MYCDERMLNVKICAAYDASLITNNNNNNNNGARMRCVMKNVNISLLHPSGYDILLQLCKIATTRNLPRKSAIEKEN